MKALVGIDTMGAWKPALNLLCRLWPNDLEVELVHCIESVLPDGSFPVRDSQHPLSLLFLEHKQQGEEALAEAAEVLQLRGVPTSKHIHKGDPARVLTEHADKSGCNLVVVRSSVKGFWGLTFFGSTAKGVLMGAKQSVLVIKTDHAYEGHVDSVVATDHSQYMNQCIDLLVAMKPTGLGRVTVYTANEIDSGVSALLVRGLPGIAHEASHWMQEKLVEMNEHIAGKLAPFSTSTAISVRDAGPHEGIRAAMDEANAELLIMGAQGHGFFERLKLGSKSFHQVLSEPHSVLIMRPG